MIFNYDKESGKLGGNSENLKKSWQNIKDFFTKKQDVVEKYNLSKNEQNAFAAIKDRLSTAILSEDSANNRSLIADVMAEFTGADSALVKFAQDTEVTQISQENFAKSQEKVIQGTTKFRAALTSVGSVIKSVGASMLNMGIAMVASWAIGKVFESIYNYIHHSENLIKAGKEAKESIDSTFESFSEGKQSIMDLGSSFSDQSDKIKNTGDAIDQVAKKYTELRSGVNQNTNENVSLSTEEYQEYVDLSSQLSSQFPGLVSGYDEQGNAVLNLSKNADIAATSIRNLYEAQVASAHVDMGKNLQAVYDGTITQIGKLEDENLELKDQVDSLDKMKNGELYEDVLKQIDSQHIKIDARKYGSISGDYFNELTQMMNDLGIQWESTPYDAQIDPSSGEIYQDFGISNIIGTEQQINDLKDKIKSLGEQTAATYSLSAKQYNANELLIRDQWKNISQSFGEFLQTSDAFTGLDQELQNAFLSNIGNLNLDALQNDYDGKVLPFLYNEFITPMSQMEPDAQKAITNLLKVDPSKLTLDDYKSKVDKAFKDAFGDDTEAQEQFKNAYGFDSSIEEMQDNASRLKEAYADFPDSADFIDKMQINDLSIAIQLMNDGSLDFSKGVDGIASAIEKYKKKVAEAKSDTTLAGLLGDTSDEGLSKKVDTFQSDISTIEATLQSLKTGDFKESDITDLMQQFPQLIGTTDDLQTALNKIKLDKAKALFKNIDDGLENATDKELQNAKAFKQNLLKSVDFTDTDKKTIRDELISQVMGDTSENSLLREVKGIQVNDFMKQYASMLSTNTGKEAIYKALLIDPELINKNQEEVTQTWKDNLPTAKDIIQDTDIQSQLTDYQDKYQSLYQAQKDLKNGLMTGSTRKTFLDKFPDLAKYAGNTETLSSTIDDLMDSMDSDVTNQFTDAIEALRDAGEDVNADALQKYVDDVIAGAHDIEGAYKEIAGLKIPTPQYEAAKDASSTENGGATYDDMLSMYNTAKEAYEKGLVGTDDFKTTAAMFSPTGSDDYTNFAENMSKIEKYFTEGSDGCINFLNDLQALGLAEQENGNWTYSLGNNMEELKETADKLGIGFEPLMSVFGKLEDYGFYNDFFTTEEAGTEKISDLYSQLAAEKMRLAQIKANPNTEDYDTALSESEKKIAEFEERIKNANVNMDELVDKKGKYTKEQTDYAKSVAQTMIDDINNTDDVQLKEVLQKQLDSFAKDYHLIIDVDGNITSLEEQIDTIEPDVEINLSATGDDLDSEISDLSKYLQGLRESSDIDVNTDKISAAETILKTLIERKQELEAPAVMNISDDQLNSVNADLQNVITAIQNYQTAVNELDKQKSLGLDTSNAQKAVNDAKAELDSIDDETKKTLKFDIQGLDDAGIQDAINKLDLSAFDDGIQQLTYHFNIDNETDVDAFLDKIAGLPKDAQSISISVNVDEVSRKNLELINSSTKELQGSNPSLSVSITGVTDGYKTSVDEARDYAENQKPKIKIDGDKTPAITAANNAVTEISSMVGTIQVGADISSMVNMIQSELNKPHSVNVTANVTTNVKNNSGGTGGGFASGTMLRVAHASGTAYNVLNYSPAHADGNVGLGSDERALVNELPDGPESIVRDGKWMIIPGGAHFENLKKGDIIFNSKQTSELINSGRVISGGGHARALAGGTVHSGMSAFLDGSAKGGGNSFGLNQGKQDSATKADTKATKDHTSATKSSTKATKNAKKVWDWVEVRIKWWGKQVKKISDKITDYIDKSLKQSLLKQQISKMNYEIGSNKKGAAAYMKKANKVAKKYTYYNSDGTAIETFVSKKYRKLVQKGAYRVEDMDTSTDKGKALAEAIEQYQTWYNKAEDCKQAVVDLKKEQMELFEQLANMPTEKAEQALEQLQNGFNGLNATQSRLSATQAGGSTQKALVEAAQASYQDAIQTESTAQNNYDNAKKESDNADKTFKNKKKKLLNSKGLTDDQKKQIRSGKKIDTSKIANKTTKKRAEEYNASVTAKSKANSKKKSTQSALNLASQNTKNLRADAENATNGYQNGNELSFMDAMTDKNTSQVKDSATINNQAWVEAKKNLETYTKAKSDADTKVGNKAKDIIKNFGSKLSAGQKKKLNSGKEINADNIKDKKLAKALKAYNKSVQDAADATQKLTIVTDAESTAAANAAQSQVEAAQATVEATQTKFDNAKTYYEAAIGYQEKLNELMESGIELSSAHGNYEKSSDYDTKISNTTNIRTLKQNEVDELEKRLQEGIDNGTIVEGSQEWTNMKSEIVDAKKAVADYDVKIEQLKQSKIGAYYEEQFDRAIDKINQFKDRLDTLKGVISDDMKVDKNTGLLTEWGATSVMLNRNQFSANQEEMRKLLEERKQIEKDYAAGNFGEKTYDEKMKNVQSQFNSLISSNSSLQNEMLSLVKTQAQAELDALNKVISKRKEALSAKKNYYDYDKTLKDKTKDIQILERQAAALQGSTNAEDKARFAKIQEQLSEAREDLSDTMTDHAFSMQSDALDKLSSDMSDDFDKWSNDISSNVEKMSKAINEAVSNSALSNAQVLNNLSTILKNVGLTDEQVSSTLSGITGYASGTNYVPKSGMYRVNEKGMESVLSRKYGTLTFLNQGDKVFTADFTKRLIDNAGIATQSSQPQFGEMYKELMNAITNTNNQSYEHSTVYNIVVNEATDANAVGDIVVKKIDAYEKKRVRDFKSLR